MSSDHRIGHEPFYVLNDGALIIIKNKQFDPRDLTLEE